MRLDAADRDVTKCENLRDKVPGALSSNSIAQGSKNAALIRCARLQYSSTSIEYRSPTITTTP